MVSIPSEKREVKGKDVLFLFDTTPQSQGTGQNDVTAVELCKQFDALSGDFDSYSEAVVDVALERLDMIPVILFGILYEFIGGPWR